MLLYRACTATEIQFDDDDFVFDAHAALAHFTDGLASWTKGLRAGAVVVALSSPESYRKALLPVYKSNRSNIRKPEGLRELRSRVCEAYEAISEPQLEADDILGIRCSFEPSCVAVSLDKDMATFPGNWWNPGRQEYRTTTEAQADLAWMRQTLTGDTIDGYQGIPKVGPVRAAKTLPYEADIGTLWSVVCDTYEAKGLTEQHAIDAARMARILRHNDYDFATGTIRNPLPERLGERDRYAAEYRLDAPKGRVSGSRGHPGKA